MSVISNLSRQFKLFLLLLLTIVIWLFRQHQPEPEQVEQQNNVQRSSDYAMTDFTMTVMDLNGKPARIIHGEEIAHYPETDNTEITNSVTDFIDPGKDTWQVSANHGITTGDSKIILLTGNVIISNKDDPGMKMLTEKLTVNTNLNTAYTDEAATIYSDEGVTKSVGLHADMNERIVNLHSKVKGVYNAP